MESQDENTRRKKDHALLHEKSKTMRCYYNAKFECGANWYTKDPIYYFVVIIFCPRVIKNTLLLHNM